MYISRSEAITNRLETECASCTSVDLLNQSRMQLLEWMRSNIKTIQKCRKDGRIKYSKFPEEAHEIMDSAAELRGEMDLPEDIIASDSAIDKIPHEKLERLLALQTSDSEHRSNFKTVWDKVVLSLAGLKRLDVEAHHTTVTWLHHELKDMKYLVNTMSTQCKEMEETLRGGRIARLGQSLFKKGGDKPERPTISQNELADEARQLPIYIDTDRGIRTTYDSTFLLKG